MVIGSEDIDAPLLVHLLEEVHDSDDGKNGTESVWQELASRGYRIVQDYDIPNESLLDTPTLTKRELDGAVTGIAGIAGS